MVDEPPTLLKVILESGAYPGADSVGSAAQLAIDERGRLREDVDRQDRRGSLARRRSGDARRDCGGAEDGRVGLKPSGGIRSFDDAMDYVDLADR